MNLGLQATLALVALASLPAAASGDDAGDEHGPPRAGTIGLLEWKRLGSALAQDCPPELAALSLFATPQGSEPIAWIEPARADPGSGADACLAPSLRDRGGRVLQLPLREHGYEEVSLMVNAVAAPAYRVAVDRGWAWLVTDADAVYRSYESLLPERLTYLTPAFDGVLCPAPLADERCIRLAPPAAHEQPAVRVLSQTRADADADLWLQVEVLDGWCGMQEPVVLAQGWIRGFDSVERVSVWFHARGC